jgi:hypothetical protein
MNQEAESKSEGELSAVVIRTDGHNDCPQCHFVGEPLELRETDGDYRCLRCQSIFTIPIRREDLGVIARTS